MQTDHIELVLKSVSRAEARVTGFFKASCPKASLVMPLEGRTGFAGAAVLAREVSA
jgi:hypothetical protein